MVRVMKVFKVSVFENKDGTIDTSKFMVKISRRSLHPGVATCLLVEALGVTAINPQETAPELKEMFGYVRGSRYHMWCLTAPQLEQVSAFLAKISGPDLQAHLVELRKSFVQPWTEEDEPEQLPNGKYPGDGADTEYADEPEDNSN